MVADEKRSKAEVFMKDVTLKLRSALASHGPLYIARRAAEKGAGRLALRLRTLPYELRMRGLPNNRAFLRLLSPTFRTIDSYLEHIERKPNPFLPEGCDTVSRFAQELKSRYPTIERDAATTAEPFLRREFEMLGQRFNFDKGPVDWHASPTGTPRWPKQHVDRIRAWLWSPYRGKDWLQVWELNRHQFFVFLARAHLLSGDRQYADEFSGMARHWISENPQALGMNWFSPMEICVRLISWSMAFYFFRDGGVLSREFKLEFLKSLHQQTRYVRKHLTLYWVVQNNWLISQAAGLVVVGSLFPEFNESADWVETGMSLLNREVVAQTSLDGVNREQAVGYHHYVVDLLIIVQALGNKNLAPYSPSLARVVEKMLEYVLYSMDPQGRLTPVGDTDEGWGFRITGRSDYWDLRHWLALGAVWFNRSDFKYFVQDFSEEAFWLAGALGAQRYDSLKAAPPAETSHAFHDGGHYFLRDDWTGSSDFLMVRSGEFGLGGEGYSAHAHCDLLSLVLWIGGHQLLIDGGTYSYDGELRDYFRTDGAHTTITIADRSQADPKRDFSWSNVPEGRCTYFDGNRVDVQVPDLHGATVSRSIAHPRRGVWHVEDVVSARDPVAVTWTFNFAPDLRLDTSQRTVLVEKPGLAVPFAIVSTPSDVSSGIESGWYSADYGHKARNQRLVCRPGVQVGPEPRAFYWKIVGYNAEHGP